jgi:NTP pyrophosphatase (non-canonical NTP hydrolase)
VNPLVQAIRHSFQTIQTTTFCSKVALLQTKVQFRANFIKTMTIQAAQQTVDEWIRTIGIRYYSELTNTAILMEEVGEVARLMSRLYGEQSFKTPELAASAPADLADEMADVLFVLICLANQTNIDLTEALRKNLEKKTSRDAARHANNPKLS